MAIVTASAKLYQGIRCYVVDKNISAALTATFTIGNQNQPSPTLDGNGNIILQSGVKVFKIVRTIADLLCPRPKPSLVNERYKTYGGGNNVINADGSVDNTNNSKITATLTCQFPTYFRLDPKTLGLPEGQDCIIMLEEGFVYENQGTTATNKAAYPTLLSTPSPRNDSFVSFRTPKTLSKTLSNIVSTVYAFTGRIRPFASNISSAMAFTVKTTYQRAGAIILTGGAGFILPIAVKTARTGAFVNVVSTIVAPMVRAREALANFNVLSSLSNDSASGRIRRFTIESPVASFITNTISIFRNPGAVTTTISSSLTAVPVKNVKPITTQPVLTSLTMLPRKIVSASSYMTVTATCQKDDDIVWVWRGSSFAGAIFQTNVGTANAYSATIFWGDGTSADISGYTNIAHFHQYPYYGDWTVRLRPNQPGSIQGIGNAFNSLGSGGPAYTHPNAGPYVAPTQSREAAWTGFSGGLSDGHLLKFISFGGDFGIQEGSSPSSYNPYRGTGVQIIDGLFKNQRFLEEVPDVLPSNIGRVRELFQIEPTQYKRWDTIDHTRFGKHIEKWDVSHLRDMEEMMDMVPSGQYIDYAECDFRKWKNVATDPTYAYPNFPPNLSGFCGYSGGRINQDLSGWCIPNVTAASNITAGPLGVNPIAGTCGGTLPTVSSVVPSTTSVLEGQTITFTINVSNMTEGVVYWRINYDYPTYNNPYYGRGSIDATNGEPYWSDINDNKKRWGTLNIVNGVATISILINTDVRVENAEYFKLDVYRRANYTQDNSTNADLIAQSPQITIVANNT